MVTQGLKSITQTVGSAIQLFQISTPLTLTMLSTMPILYVLLNLYGAYLRRLSKENKQLDGYAGGVAGEVSFGSGLRELTWICLLSYCI